MVDITHDWDEEDYGRTLDEAFDEYRKWCYGDQELSSSQLHETRQAFLCGIHWLNTRESYAPDDLETALRKILIEG